MRQLDPGRVSCVKRDEDRRDYKVAFGKLRDSLGFEPRRRVPAGVREVAGASSRGESRTPGRRATATLPDRTFLFPSRREMRGVDSPSPETAHPPRGGAAKPGVSPRSPSCQRSRAHTPTSRSPLLARGACVRQLGNGYCRRRPRRWRGRRRAPPRRPGIAGARTSFARAASPPACKAAGVPFAGPASGGGRAAVRRRSGTGLAGSRTGSSRASTGATRTAFGVATHLWLIGTATGPPSASGAPRRRRDPRVRASSVYCAAMSSNAVIDGQRRVEHSE